MYNVVANGLQMSAFRDGHAHLRQMPLTATLIAEMLKGGTVGGVFMPNTKPPISRVFRRDHDDTHGWSIEGYMDMLKANGGDAFDCTIVPLYLSAETTPDMIRAGARAGVLKSIKYYPPHGTTNSDHGIPMDGLIGSDVLKAMEEEGVILNIHGEEHGQSNQNWFDKDTNAEDAFYKTKMPSLLEAHPNLKIVCEHITTRTAVNFVKAAGENVKATITPQHILYTVGDLLKRMETHMYCQPLPKFEDDRQACMETAVGLERISGTESRPYQFVLNTKFMAGTDQAPHLLMNKMVDCGCASGAYFGETAIQMYAMAFDKAGVDIMTPEGAKAFHTFMVDNFNRTYGVPASDKVVLITRKPASVHTVLTPAGEIKPMAVGMNPNHAKQGTTIPYSVEYMDMAA
ncbi:MAG: hypothetical protein WAX89_01995 [Alphaproteobacteria bacterium]